MNLKLVAIIATVGVLVASVAGAGASVATNAQHHRHRMRAESACPLHRTANGELVDCHGWRLRNTARGWDNTCFNLDYLPSQFACSSK